jgi:glyoxylase-like metal-dependent hydrolase (beta-lactamase superfamily II)
LAQRFEKLGGLAYIFLTHRDDVADAERYAEHFGAQRIIHRVELKAQPDAEIVIDGEESIQFQPGFEIIVTPGHTQGHMVLLFNQKFLFTGDHLSWDPDAQELRASRDFCWYSWTKQRESMDQLSQKRFEWVLPGHGSRIYLPAERMSDEMKALVQRMNA